MRDAVASNAAISAPEPSHQPVRVAVEPRADLLGRGEHALLEVARVRNEHVREVLEGRLRGREPLRQIIQQLLALAPIALRVSVAAPAKASFRSPACCAKALACACVVCSNAANRSLSSLA